MDGKAVKNAIRKNGDGKKGNSDDRPNDAKVDELAEKVTGFIVLFFFLLCNYNMAHLLLNDHIQSRLLLIFVVTAFEIAWHFGFAGR